MPSAARSWRRSKLQRQRRRRLDDGERNRGVHRLHAGKARQVIEEEGLVGLDVPAHDPQQEIRLPHQRVTLEDLGVRTHRLLEAQQGLAPVSGDLHVREHHDREPELLAIEQRHALDDAATSLRAIIAIHSTALGPAAGGCRMWPYATTADAVCDALRLSRGMSYKNALAGVPFGGGKAVIIGESRQAKTPQLFEAFGRLVDSLGGRYLTAEDIGTTTADMASVARATRHVAGLGRAPGEAGGDPGPKTALGVYLGIEAAVRFRLGRQDLQGLTVAVQGVGGVGYHL